MMYMVYLWSDILNCPLPLPMPMPMPMVDPMSLEEGGIYHHVCLFFRHFRCSINNLYGWNYPPMCCDKRQIGVGTNLFEVILHIREPYLQVVHTFSQLLRVVLHLIQEIDHKISQM